MHLIPCPVCGGDLTVEGDRWVDCAEGHRSRTDPRLYETLRLRAVLVDIRDTLCFIHHDLQACTGDHSWTDARGIPELPVRICVHCLTLAVVDESRRGRAK